MTYRQATELHAHVRKGEHGSLIVFANKLIALDRNDDGEEIEREIPYMRGYTVFNVEQIEGLPAHYYPPPGPPQEKMPLIAAAERLLAATGATVHHDGNRACYSPSLDVIRLPRPEAFKDVASRQTTHGTLLLVQRVCDSLAQGIRLVEKSVERTPLLGRRGDKFGEL